MTAVEVSFIDLARQRGECPSITRQLVLVGGVSCPLVYCLKASPNDSSLKRFLMLWKKYIYIHIIK